MTKKTKCSRLLFVYKILSFILSQINDHKHVCEARDIYFYKLVSFLIFNLFLTCFSIVEVKNSSEAIKSLTRLVFITSTIIRLRLDNSNLKLDIFILK